MRDSIRSLRLLGGHAFPIHLLEVLVDGSAYDSLDGITKPLHSSPMNETREQQALINGGPVPADGGATLFSFLDVADTLYERISDALGRVGLSYAKYEVLKQLHEADSALTLGALAEGACCARSNITQIVDRLETDGLVRRVDDPDDRRSVRAELTEPGSAQAAEGTTQIDLVRAQFAASFTASERLELGRLLAKIR